MQSKERFWMCTYIPMYMRCCVWEREQWGGRNFRPGGSPATLTRWMDRASSHSSLSLYPLSPPSLSSVILWRSLHVDPSAPSRWRLSALQCERNAETKFLKLHESAENEVGYDNIVSIRRKRRRNQDGEQQNEISKAREKETESGDEK